MIVISIPIVGENIIGDLDQCPYFKKDLDHLFNRFLYYTGHKVMIFSLSISCVIRKNTASGAYFSYLADVIL